MVGTGDVGSHILEFIARDENSIEWIVGDIDESKAKYLCNNASIGAAHHGKYPVFNPEKIDLFNIEKTAEFIKKEKRKSDGKKYGNIRHCVCHSHFSVDVSCS